MNRLNVEKLPELEARVKEQVDKRSYDADVNNAVLKLYKFYPAKANKQLIIVILIKALVSAECVLLRSVLSFEFVCDARSTLTLKRR